MTVPKNGSKYDVRTCPPYQVTHTSCQAGKMFTGSKHRVTFAFGFANPDALSQGLTGPEARGEEHEVKLVWSHTSGKRQVIADNEEVHFSVGKKLEPRFETSWTMEGGHTVKLVAHATQALFNTPGFRQFELFLDGMSYFAMPKIYELGQKSVNVRQGNAFYQQNSQSYMRGNNYDEGRDFAQPPTRAIESSPRVSEEASESSKRLASVSSPSGVVDMPNAQTIDLLASQDNDLLASSAPQLHSANDEFTPTEFTPQPPSFSLVTNQIMSAYSPTPITPTNSQSAALVPYGMVAPSPVATTYSPNSYEYSTTRHHCQQQTYPEYQPLTPTPYYDQSAMSYHTPPSAHQPYYNQSQAVEQNNYQTPTSNNIGCVQEQSNVPAVKLTMAPITIEDIEEQKAAELNGVVKAVHTLVNLDDITEKRASPEDRKFQQKKEQTHRQVKSQPLPPKQSDWSLGLKPNLQAMKEHAPQKSAPTKEIMRTHAFDPNAAQAGMMVAYGTQPPLQPMMMHPGPYYCH